MAYGENALYIDVELDETRLDEMLRYSNGAMGVPVIVEEGKVTVGYGGS
jgi:glutaredoxin 3